MGGQRPEAAWLIRLGTWPESPSILSLPFCHWGYKSHHTWLLTWAQTQVLQLVSFPLGLQPHLRQSLGKSLPSYKGTLMMGNKQYVAPTCEHCDGPEQKLWLQNWLSRSLEYRDQNVASPEPNLLGSILASLHGHLWPSSGCGLTSLWLLNGKYHELYKQIPGFHLPERRINSVPKTNGEDFPLGCSLPTRYAHRYLWKVSWLMTFCGKTSWSCYHTRPRDWTFVPRLWPLILGSRIINLLLPLR